MHVFSKSLEYNIRGTGKNCPKQYLNITSLFFSYSKKNLLFRVGLCDRPTIYSGESSQFHREGFILSITLEDGSIGCGEVGYFILLFFIT